MRKEMTQRQHKARHVLLHKELDELVADMIMDTGRRPSSTTVLDLMMWSHSQTKKPTDDNYHSNPKKRKR